MNNHLLRAKEIAERLSVSRSQVFALINNGQIPVVRFGRCVRVRPEDLENFINANISGTSPIKAKPVAGTTDLENHLATSSMKGYHHG